MLMPFEPSNGTKYFSNVKNFETVFNKLLILRKKLLSFKKRFLRRMNESLLHIAINELFGWIIWF